MKPGDLIRANFLSVRYTKETKIGIVLDYQDNYSEHCGKIKILCDSGEIREFITGYGDGLEVINDPR